MNKILFALVFFALGLTASAQQIHLLKVDRFNASLTSSQNVLDDGTTAPTIKVSQTDTTEWFMLSSLPATGSAGIDSILQAVIFLDKSTDSLKGSYKIQYGVGLKPSLVAPFTASTIDSIAKNVPGSSFDYVARAQSVWHRKPAGANAIRIIVATAAAGCSFGEKRTYNVGVIFRSK